MVSIAVCDDEPLHAAHTRDVILRHGNIDSPIIRLFESSDVFLKEINLNNYSPQIAILDIRLAEISGIDLASHINEILPGCAIIFLTAFPEYATDVYETQHVYFIVKNELEMRIERALKKALAVNASDNYIFASVKAGIKKIPTRDVIYMERILHKTALQTKSGREITSASPSELLKTVSSVEFIQCHQSFWVNFRHIDTMSKNEFIMSDGTRIPISRTFRSNAKDLFFSLMR